MKQETFKMAIDINDRLTELHAHRQHANDLLNTIIQIREVESDDDEKAGSNYYLNIVVSGIGQTPLLNTATDPVGFLKNYIEILDGAIANLQREFEAL